MATKRKEWDSLTPTYRARLSRAGITKAGFEGGASIQKARGHAATPEHGVAQALKNPAKFSKYIAKKNVPAPGLSAMQEAIRKNAELDKAFKSMERFKNYIKYNPKTVRANVYGGRTSESGDVSGMDYATATWTSNADMEEIRSMAREQFRGNPWWYH